MVLGECVLVRAIERQHRNHARDSLKRHGQRRAQRAVLSGIVQVSGLNRWIAVENRLAVLRNPSRQAFAERNS